MLTTLTVILINVTVRCTSWDIREASWITSSLESVHVSKMLWKWLVN